MTIPNKPSVANPDLTLITSWGGTQEKPTNTQISQGFGTGTALGKYYASTTINWNNDYFFQWQNWCANSVDYIAKNTELYVDSGTNNAFNLTILSGEAPTAYSDGMRVRFYSNFTNTSACTIDVEGIGAKSIVTYDGDALVNSQVDDNKYIEAVYDLANDRFVIANITFTDAFVKIDGTTPFTDTQEGVTPTTANHLATKGYVDSVGLPTGTILQFASPTPPSGYLTCEGQAVSRTTYASLFAVIGTIYGVGNGSTTFNLPDYRGKFARGFDNGAGVDAGRTFGSLQYGTNVCVGDPSKSSVVVSSFYNNVDNSLSTLITALGGEPASSTLNGSNVLGISVANSTSGSGTGFAMTTRPINLSTLYIIKI